MDLQEYHELTALKPEPAIVMAKAMDGETRTLLYGYTCDRDTFHVFQHEGLLHRVIYSYPNQVKESVSGEVLPAASLVPDKRVYPNLSDYAFCRFLKEHGIGIPFTTFDPEKSLEDRGNIAGLTGIDEIDNRPDGLSL